jgi:hypothetical protein
VRLVDPAFILRGRFISVLYVVAMALPFAAPCRGGPIYTVQLQEGATWGSGLGNSLSYDSGQLAQTSVSNTVNGGGPGGTAEASGSISDGEIHGLAESQGLTGVTDANLTAFWNDAITVGGLPDGTLVTLLITDSLHSLLTLSGATSQASAVSQVTIFAGGTDSFLDLSNTSSNLQNGNQTTSMELTCAASSLSCFQLTEELALRASTFPGGLAIADASNTNQIFIDVLTPGATITSASGVIYADTAVPEPATAGPVLLTLGGLLVVVRRNRETGFRGGAQ